LVPLAKITKRDWSVDSGDDLRESDLIRGFGEHITPANTALRLHEPGAFQRQEYLFEVRLG